MTMNKFLEGRRYRTVIKRERQIPPLLTAFFRDGVVFYLVYVSSLSSLALCLSFKVMTFISQDYG
jgi:hypothetical protein